MKKPSESTMTKEIVPADIWIERLSSLLKVVAAMDKDERSAAFAFLKSKFSGEWPRDDY